MSIAPLRSRARRAGLALVAGLAALTACNRTQLVQGDCRPANGADVCTWGETTGGTLVAFGATVPLAAIENAPADAPMAWPPLATAVVPMPEAVQSATGFQSLTMFWEPHGHPPGPYLTPHFDFHFNTTDVRPIDCADTTKPAQLPAGYALPDVTDPELGTLVGLCVPKMGMHSLPQAALTDTTIFKAAMLVGYYHGEPIFVEPMIARAALLERRSFPLDVPAVPDRPAAVRLPTTFRADYDSTAQAYRFVFGGLTAAGG